jgi:hypothetical protein
MSFRQNSYCTVWEVKQGAGNYTDARISSSRKNKQTGEYETDFSGFVRFIGGAHQKAASLKEKDRIKLGDCEVTNHYDKEKKVTYTNFAVFDFEMANGSQQTTQTQPTVAGFEPIPNDIDEELPFA